jgi:hypothetical protein
MTDEKLEHLAIAFAASSALIENSSKDQLVDALRVACAMLGDGEKSIEPGEVEKAIGELTMDVGGGDSDIDFHLRALDNLTSVIGVSKAFDESFGSNKEVH